MKHLHLLIEQGVVEMECFLEAPDTSSGAE
jgi:hypothetical protein